MVVRAAVALLCVITAACASAPGAGASPTRAAGTAVAATELQKLIARGTLIVAIRMEAPPTTRVMGDPAHAQKRAFESAVATIVATAVLGPSARVEFRSVGADRIGALEQGADLAMTVETPTSRDRAIISTPYAASSLVLAAKEGGPIRRAEDVSGKVVGAAMDELGARDLAQAFFQQRAITTTLETFQGVNGAVGALESERVVAFVGDGIGVTVLAADRKLAIVTAIAPRPYIIATRKSAPDLASAVDAALRTALASGAIKDAAAKAGFPYQSP